MGRRIFHVPVRAIYTETVEVLANDEDEARRLILTEGYADGADHVVEVFSDPDPEIEIAGEIEETGEEIVMP